VSLLDRYEEAASDWLARVRTLTPIVAQHRQAIEAERKLPAPLFLAMHDAGLFRMWLPTRFGGCEVDLVTTRLAIEAAARLDGSVGWYVSILNESAALAAYLPDAGAREIYADPNTVVAGAGFPPGQAVVVEGGYRVSGEWALASGSPHAGWLFGGAFIIDADQSQTEAGHAAEAYVFPMPASQCTVLDTWFSTGLRGSGSHHFKAENVFVPAHLRASMTSGRQIAGSIYPEVYVRMLSPNHAAVGLGVALGALDAFKDLAGTKPGSRGQPPIGEQQTVHALIGRSEVRLTAARLSLHEASADTDDELRTTGDISEERFLLNRLTGAHVAAEATDVVSQLYTAAGSTAVYQSNRLDRALRDVHTVNQHVSTSPANFAHAGRHLLNGG